MLMMARSAGPRVGANGSVSSNEEAAETKEGSESMEEEEGAETESNRNVSDNIEKGEGTTDDDEEIETGDPMEINVIGVAGSQSNAPEDEDSVADDWSAKSLRKNLDKYYCSSDDEEGTKILKSYNLGSNTLKEERYEICK
jgi:hypothetical protein